MEPIREKNVFGQKIAIVLVILDTYSNGPNRAQQMDGPNRAQQIGPNIANEWLQQACAEGIWEVYAPI